MCVGVYDRFFQHTLFMSPAVRRSTRHQQQLFFPLWSFQISRKRFYLTGWELSSFGTLYSNFSTRPNLLYKVISASNDDLTEEPELENIQKYGWCKSFSVRMNYVPGFAFVNDCWVLHTCLAQLWYFYSVFGSLTKHKDAPWSLSSL